MALEPRVGMTVWGEHDQRRIIVAMDEDHVTLMAPISLRQETMTRDELIAWADAGSRRTYLGADGETRIKISENEIVVGDEVMAAVDYMVLGAVQIVTAPIDEWTAWRATAA